MIEGEEECGSDSLEDFVVSNKEKLTADVKAGQKDSGNSHAYWQTYPDFILLKD